MRKYLVLFIAALMMAAACTDSGGDAADGDSDKSENGSEQSDNGSDQSGGSNGGDFCELADAVENAPDLDMAWSPDELERQMGSLLDTMHAALDVVPDQIADAVALMVGATESMVGAMEDAGWSILDVDNSVFAEANTPELEAARAELYDYLRDECGLDIEEPDDTLGDEADDDGPDLDMDGTLRDSIVQSMMAGGLSEADANCYVDKAIERDVLDASDQSAVLQLFSDCGIDPATLGQPPTG